MKKIFTGNDTLFYNSQCMVVEYNDVLKVPWFTVLKFIQDNDTINNIYDLSQIKRLKPDELFEWYIHRKERNIYDNFLYNRYIEDRINDENYNSKLLKGQLELDEIFFTIDTQLNFFNTLSIVCTQKKLLKKIIVYNEDYNEYMEKDIINSFNNNVEFRYGDFKEVIQDIPNDSTYVFSDINKINLLLESHKLSYSSILMCNGYRYNNINRDELKVDIEKLQKEYTFKIDFFENIYVK